MRSVIDVWTWLPGSAAPVLAGEVHPESPGTPFRYDASYRDRSHALALGPDLPLQQGARTAAAGLDLHGTLNDALPNAWGHRVIRYFFGLAGAEPSIMQLMLAPTSNRFGAICFRTPFDAGASRSEPAPLADLLGAAELFDAGDDVPQALMDALLRGAALGGARPKACFTAEDGTEWIAKFPSASDRGFPAVRAEAAALDPARRCGLRVPESRLVAVAGSEALLVRRFDRGEGGTRRHVVSAATLLGANPERSFLPRYSYLDIADVLRQHSKQPETIGLELLDRIAFAIATGNTDDHLRNHAAFWDGEHLELTPAYDLAPQMRSGSESNQALFFAPGERRSSLRALLEASAFYGLTREEAEERIAQIVGTIAEHWAEAADAARVTSIESAQLRARQIIPEASLWELPPTSPIIAAARGT